MCLKPNNRVIILLAAVLLFSCEVINDITGIAVTEKPPFTITKPLVETAERPYYFSYAGIIFQFLNKSGKTADYITVRFMLFDAGTHANPFIGSNVFEITWQDLIPAGENREIIISLDKYIHIAPSDPYLIDFFNISEIHYDDGSVWRDINGIYGERSAK